MTAQSAQRLCVRLDPAMLLEGLLLERLSRVPKGRRQEWLRGLLVQGYLWEGRSSRDVPHDTKAPSPAGYQAENQRAASAMAFAGWPTRQRPYPPQVLTNADLLRQTERTTAGTPTAPKPFAHLRKVIG